MSNDKACKRTQNEHQINNNQEIMMKKTLLLLFLLTTLAKPACGQPAITDGAADNGDGRSVNLYISGAMSLNPSCSDEKLGGGGVIDVEWQFSPWLGVGIGGGYSSEAVHYEATWKFSNYWPYSNTSKHDDRLSLVNVPLRLYVHPAEWLTLDAGLQWSYIVGDASIKDVSHSCLSLPFGISFGSRHHFFIRYQPRLGGLVKSGTNSTIKSNQLLLGVGISI